MTESRVANAVRVFAADVASDVRERYRGALATAVLIAAALTLATCAITGSW
jgi:hypothetical protein